MGRSTELNVRLKGDSASYTNAVFKGKAANDAFNRSVGGVSKGLTAINGPLNGVSGRFSALNSLVNSSAGKMALFGAAMAGSALAVASSVKEFDNYERQQLKVQQLLETTGYAAGLSSKALEDNANAVALATLASVEEINDAQGVLLSFKAVQGETFTDAIMLAQDMAAVFGGSAKEKALQLGKALESPTEGLTALKRSGVSFTESEKDMIRQMDATGQRAEAQRFILEKLADQVGGSGRAQAGGLSGSVDTLGQRWDELQRKWADSSGSAKAVQGWIDSLAASLNSLGESIEPSVDGLTNKLAELETRLTGVRGRGAQGKRNYIANQIAQVREELLFARAQSGDMDALNESIERTQNNINALGEKSAGRNGRMKRNGNAELKEQKGLLAQLIALRSELNRQEQVSKETQAQTNGHEFAGIGVTAQQAQVGLDSVRQALATRAEIELAATQSRQEMIDNAFMTGLINADLQYQLTENLWQAHQAKLTNIQTDQAKKRAQAEKASQRDVLSAYSQTSGEFLLLMEESGAKQGAVYKVLFATQKAAQVAMTIANANAAAEAVTAREAPVMGLGAIAAGNVVRGLGYASAGIIAGTAIAGAFEQGGIVPGASYTGDNVLAAVNSGEMILNQSQQKALFDVANGANKSGTGVVVNLIEDNSRAGQVVESQGANGEQMIDVFVANIREGGAAAQQLEGTYGLSRQGR